MPELIVKILYGEAERNEINRSDQWMRQNKAWALSQAVGILIHQCAEAGVIDLREHILEPKSAQRAEVAGLRVVAAKPGGN